MARRNGTSSAWATRRNRHGAERDGPGAGGEAPRSAQRPSAQDAVYSSTLSRSRETAEIARGQAPLKSFAGLSERKLGKFEGRRVDASDAETAAEYKRRGLDPDDALDGGESRNQFFERVRSTISSIRGQHARGSDSHCGPPGYKPNDYPGTFGLDGSAGTID